MIDLYDFITALNEASQPDDIINPSASGMAANVILQTWKVKEGQRFITNFVLGEMGAGLPYSIGAALATGKRVIHIEGDGGFQLNIQELETIRRLNLPIIIFVINNNGYASIRQSQQKNFGRLTGADDTSGLTLPSLQDIARSYDYPFLRLDNEINWQAYLNILIMNLDMCHQLIEVMVHPDQEYHHRVGSNLVDGKMTSGRLEDV